MKFNKDPLCLPQSLSLIIEKHLKSYFNAHEGLLPPTGLYGRIICEVEKPLIVETLRAVQGNQVRAAEILGIHRNTLRKKIHDLGLNFKKV